MIKHFNV